MLWPIIGLLFALQLHAQSPRPVEPRQSCRDHFLSGQTGTKVLPLLAGKEVYNVECEMPSDPESLLPVGLSVRNALERWTRLDSEPKTVGYQIKSWAFLRWTMAEADTCFQELSVSWIPDLASDRMIEFTVESIRGKSRTFHFNSSKTTVEEVFVLENEYAGVLHIFPPENMGNMSIELKTTALRCRQSVVPNAKCLFELNSRSDRIGIDITDDHHWVSFSFRTDIPSTPFLTLRGGDGPVRVDIIEGYLISVSQYVSPMKLLSDGHWHTAAVDVRNLVLFIDGRQNTGISLASRGRANKIDSMDIVLNGSVTGINFNGGAWECDGSISLQVYRTQHILRKICPKYEASYCQCKAPNSALMPALNRSIAKCSPPDSRKAYTLNRNSTHLAFFYYPQFRGPQTVSVVFKSDSDLGLVLLGQHKELGSSSSKQRYQVYYERDTMTAVSCLIEANQQFVCRACSIKRSGGYGRNEWIRVSLFYNQKNYQYLTVDEQICKLSPNEKAFSLNDIYNMNQLVNDVLFIGGSYYKKARGTARVKDDFKNKFFENTLEKPPSLKGCIAEIRVGGEILDMEKVLREQNEAILVDSERPVFAIEQGCLDCTELEDLCRGAPCRAVSPFQPKTPVCDCAKDFAVRSQMDGSCLQQEKDKYKPTALKLTDSEALTIEQSLGFVKQSFVDKIWGLLRFPETESDLAPIISFGEIQILVADYGRRVVVEIGGIREEFSVKHRDERLHLVSIERNPTMSASRVERTLTIRLDGDKREVRIPRIPIHAGSILQITPVPTTNKGFGGCLNGLSMSFDYDEDTMISSRYNLEDEHQHELLANIINKPVIAPNVSKLLMFGDSCGIRDPSVWNDNSTSLGLVGSYDPDGTSQTFNDEKTSLISLIVTILLILVVLFLILGYCYKRGRRHVYKTTTTSGYTPADEKLLMNGDNYTDGTSNGSPPPKIRPDFGDLSPTTPSRPLIIPGKPVIIEEKNDDYPSNRITRPVAVRRIPPTDSPSPPTSTKAPIANSEDV
ncbi:unnamed protein product [Bursaphelenchus xylophilus]|uniref:(pine wood nematode) hypothetical protein n=1 Tax=Bursaphelenchus xylophilus TaxID=6326 RepID=A0A1I7S659_BURXY|nr:unnamed protein product [Bursaphelenchus xylophilus]CAG9081015.1 unnamed protein product [Bursaphelenchus xylophilus]